ncbi:hypothetical protein CHLRE_12g490700v5 [Chlamydomonas reinhardtii]|uniref:Mini-eyespot n=1 Tax=Chlamydomonas reinhardtii TaxID=3055 RepID=Q6SR86_CHLRE|nr:uncharacterized protein CHLRE_12g490700v5 [Chlamydomonas reinhardtii]AAR20884.1 mini-eyespot [Chlamydomonas reinhardtii]PNW74605.1 hypothetical protein CHLRE_12g490700v5 [Chlamydomonas reinhardtii]|eukprot:XP_001691124.1 mini-eyespot protein [Chlamydomonas reinhardtii]
MAGKLCVSVIEARNVQADDFAGKNFYVKLRVGSNEVKTDVVKGSLAPKFLKDCRLAVPTPESDYLRIELLQVGPRGDLVVGSDDLRLLSITARGTIVHWFSLKTASRSVSAELCLVLRFLSAGANRPMSPTYAIAARQARERALDGSSEPQGPGRSAFRDLPAPATPTASTSTRYANLAAAASSPDSPAAPGLASPALSNGGGPAGSRYASPAARAATPAQASPPGQVAASPVAEPRSGPKRGPRIKGGQVPLPLAVLGGLVVGALMYMWRKRPVYYEVQEDDTLCHIASCFKKRVEDVYAKNKTILKNPNRLYPGDRLRIR